MNQITVKIEGMMCGMCEAHICDTIRCAFPEANKVKASRKNGEAAFQMEGEFSEEKLKQAIDETGYRVLSVSSEPVQKRGLFGKR